MHTWLDMHLLTGSITGRCSLATTCIWCRICCSDVSGLTIHTVTESGVKNLIDDREDSVPDVSKNKAITVNRCACAGCEAA